MKTKLLLSFIATLLFLNNVFSQDEFDYKDVINISCEDKYNIRIDLLDYSDKYYYRGIYDVYNSFLVNFIKIKDSVEFYDCYSIKTNGRNYIDIDKKDCEKRYYIDDNQDIGKNNYTNTLIVEEWNYKITINFKDLNYVIDTSIQNIINQSIEGLPKKSRWQAVFNYVYENDTLKRADNNWVKFVKDYYNLNIISGAKFGTLNGRVASGVSGGFCYMLTKKGDNNLFLSIFATGITFYDIKTDKVYYSNFIEFDIRYKMDPFYGTFGNWFGIHAGVPMSSNQDILGNKTKFKFGFSYSIGKNTWLYWDNILCNKASYEFLGVGIGF